MSARGGFLVPSVQDVAGSEGRASMIADHAAHLLVRAWKGEGDVLIGLLTVDILLWSSVLCVCLDPSISACHTSRATVQSPVIISLLELCGILFNLSNTKSSTFKVFPPISWTTRSAQAHKTYNVFDFNVDPSAIVDLSVTCATRWSTVELFEHR